jgi:hypothetical protein
MQRTDTDDAAVFNIYRGCIGARQRLVAAKTQTLDEGPNFTHLHTPRQPLSTDISRYF